MFDEEVSTVLSNFDLGPAVAVPLANAGGWSGSSLWRITDQNHRELCLRKWSAEHPTEKRLGLIHAVLTCVASELPIIPNPLRTTCGTSFVKRGGHLWELTHWLPGKADFCSNPTAIRLRAAMVALAHFHIAAANYRSLSAMPAPAFLDRRRETSYHRFGGLTVIERSIDSPLGNAIDLRAHRLLELARRLLWTPVFDLLGETIKLDVQPAIRDIHHDHVLFTGDEVTGIIDFGAMRIDTPLTDVARLVGSLARDEQEAREFALSAYSAVRPLGDLDRQLVNLFDVSGVVLGALNWLTWLYVERRDMGPVEPIVWRLDEILQRLERRESQSRFK